MRGGGGGGGEGTRSLFVISQLNVDLALLICALTSHHPFAYLLPPHLASPPIVFIFSRCLLFRSSLHFKNGPQTQSRPALARRPAKGKPVGFSPLIGSECAKTIQSRRRVTSPGPPEFHPPVHFWSTEKKKGLRTYEPS